MAAKGSATKEKISNLILQIFPNSFINGKELRICGIEDGEEIQIKLTMTAAKENVSHESQRGDSELPAPILSSIDSMPTEEELENVRRLIDKFNL